VEGYGDDCAGQMTAGVGIGFGITVAMVLLLVGIGFWWWSRQKNRRVFVFSGCDKFDKYLVGGGGASAATRGDWFPRVGTSLVDGPSLSGSYAY
jgi:hypothetical protein